MSGGCEAATPAALVPGDPEEVDWLAREYARYAAGACDAARALRRIDTGDWVGPAGDAFRTAIGEVPDKLERGQSSFARASAALADYARVLRDAQADAGLAIRRFADADAATAAWRREDESGAHDPGSDGRAAAERLLQGARARVDAAASRTCAVLDDARQNAPKEPGLLSKGIAALGSFVAGAAEATWGLAEFAYKTSPAYLLIDPEGFAQNVEDLATGLWYGVQHPKELGKAMLDWDTWADDPARALGHLVPDLVLALATAGTGQAGVAASRAAKGADAAESLLTRGVRAAGHAARLSDDDIALLERRFASPADEVVQFQGHKPYAGVDAWGDRVLMAGDTFSVGTPGEGRFAATPEAVEAVGTDARRYNEGLQVASRTDPVDGVARYRDGLNTYEVKRPFPVGESIAQANPRFGAGGLSQYFLPDRIDRLLAEGFVGEPTYVQLTDLEARIGPKGLSALERMPAPRAAAAGGGTLTAQGAIRLEECG